MLTLFSCSNADSEHSLQAGQGERGGCPAWHIANAQLALLYHRNWFYLMRG